jgi:hypothetical protein
LQAMYIGIGENSMIENSMMLWWLWLSSLSPLINLPSEDYFRFRCIFRVRESSG